LTDNLVITDKYTQIVQLYSKAAIVFSNYGIVQQMFTEKGFDNLYLLSGGCEEFLEKFSDLCEGRQVPVQKSKIA
jgi:hypothetical protein